MKGVILAEMEVRQAKAAVKEAERKVREAERDAKRAKKTAAVEARKERERQAVWAAELSKQQAEVRDLLRPFLAPGVTVAYDPSAEGVLTLILPEGPGGEVRTVTFSSFGDDHSCLSIE